MMRYDLNLRKQGLPHINAVAEALKRISMDDTIYVHMILELVVTPPTSEGIL